MCRCCCVYCTMEGVTPSEKHVSDALDHVAIFSHDVPEGIANAGIGVGLVMHGEADVHGTVQVRGGFHFRECRALDGVEVVHASTIHGLGGSAKNVCHLANRPRAAETSTTYSTLRLRRIIYLN